jgi:hypothetical protein
MKKFDGVNKKDLFTEAETKKGLPKESKKSADDKTKSDIEAEQDMRIKKAQEHWKQGHLGVTAEDHKAIGGSPDTELRQNPGKTLGELWSMEKILEYLKKDVAFLKKAREEYKEKGPNHPDIHWSRDDIFSAKESLRAAIPYLKSIGKLPEEFANFEVEDLEDDPKEEQKRDYAEAEELLEDEKKEKEDRIPKI